MILPLLAGAGILWLLFSGSPKTVVAQPQPQPQPQPPPPPTRTETLRAHVAELLRLADAAPLAVDPDAMDASAVELARVGMIAEADTVRAKANEVRVKRGLPPVNPIVPPPILTAPPAQDPNGPVVTQPLPAEPSGPTPGVIPADLAARVNAVLATPSTEPAVAVFFLIDTFEREFPTSLDVLEKLRARAKEVKAANPAATPAEAKALLSLATKEPGRVSPSFLDAIVADVVPVDPALAQAVQKKAVELRGRVRSR